MQFQDKFVAFVDILGFKQMVEASENGTGLPLPKLLELVSKLGESDDRKRFEQHGPRVCPCSRFLQRDLDFRVTQISDCVILSAEVSPAGVINLLDRAWIAVVELFVRGILCRGYVTRGRIYHTDRQMIGFGYHRAYANEAKVMAFRRDADERGTPFVEIDSVVRDYVKTEGDSCVKEMFSRMVKEDGTVAALYPFKRFAAQFVIDRNFDGEREKASNQNLRAWLQATKDRLTKFVDQANPSAVRKLEHYLAAVDEQLTICDKTDQVIDRLTRRHGGKTLPE